MAQTIRSAHALEDALFETLTGAEDPAEDLDAEARAAEPGNALRHMGSLALTKVADGLIDPKLVLAWLVTHLGAPAVFVGLLVPIREAGALLPQLFTAPSIRRMGRRKWAWAGGSLVQGLAAAGIVLTALALSGWAAGAAIAALLAVLALARSVCSVSYKDVLGKTVGKTRRGAVTGLASSISAAAVVVFAGLLISDLLPRAPLVVGAVALAAAFWIVAALVFSTLRETHAPAEARITAPLAQFGLLARDRQLTLFVVVRGLLVATALAPPFLILLAAEAGQASFDRLGLLVLASALASFVSSYVWGRLADRSSRRVLILAGGLGALALGLALAARAAGLIEAIWTLPVVLFLLMIAYHGVRQGRSTYLVDMAPKDDRAAYTAVANTAIGLILLASGLAGALISGVGPGLAVGFFAASSLAGGLAALGLKEVEALA